MELREITIAPSVESNQCQMVTPWSCVQMVMRVQYQGLPGHTRVRLMAWNVDVDGALSRSKMVQVSCLLSALNLVTIGYPQKFTSMGPTSGCFVTTPKCPKR